uniref:FAS-associated factor 2 n=1 Tax=Myxine glutinosa TaxID=7769 RepID=UPI00358EFDC8
MADQEGLSAEQTEKLLQFQDLTGIESMDQCRQTLQRHHWNIEAAVQDRLNEEEGVPRVFDTPLVAAHLPIVNPMDNRIYSYIVPRPSPRGFFGWSYYFLMIPFRFTYYTVMDILRLALRMLRPDPRAQVTDPVGDVSSFIQYFEEQYDQQHPVFYHGSYSQALNDAKRELRFLLVYLHADGNTDAALFCRETLCSPDVINFINGRALFWACSVNRPEGFRVSQALRETSSYPLLALILLKEHRMTVVARLEGLVKPRDVISQLTLVMDANEHFLLTERIERQERVETQALRRQQDEAYFESLRADQEKERRRREDREQEQRIQEEGLRQAVEEERKREKLVEAKAKCSKQLPPEPLTTDPEAVAIVFRLPNDSRVERRFLSTDSLSVIHDFVFSLSGAPENFQLVSNFPRRVLQSTPTTENSQPPNLRDVGLQHSAVLFVQNLSD